MKKLLPWLGVPTALVGFLFMVTAEDVSNFLAKRFDERLAIQRKERVAAEYWRTIDTQGSWQNLDFSDVKGNILLAPWLVEAVKNRGGGK